MSTFATALRSQARVALSACRLTAPRRTLFCRAPCPLPLNTSQHTPLIFSRGFKYEAVENNTPTETLFIANLPFDATESELRDVFSRFGEIKEVKIPKNSEGESRGFGHVVFDKLEDAVRARKTSDELPIRLSRNTLRVLYSVHHRNKSDTLSIRTEEPLSKEDIRAIFDTFGVVDIRVVPPGGRFKSYLIFVQFPNAQKANTALELTKEHPKLPSDAEMVFARPRPQRGTIIDRVSTRRSNWD